MIIIIMLFILGLGCFAGFAVYSINEKKEDKQYLASLPNEDREIELERRELNEK